MNAVLWDVEDEPAGLAAAPTLLKEQVAERLAAHRSRRANPGGAGGLNVEASAVRAEVDALTRSQRVASAVAERYAHSPSYRQLLAAEAEDATRRARAAAEISARTAEAVATAQRELMVELAACVVEEEASGFEAALPMLRESSMVADEPRGTMARVSRADLSVKLFEGAGRFSSPAESRGRGELVVEDPEEARVLDEEISFRQSPTFELERPSVAIPGNLLEFPRQLVAARKARPRYAEGPLMAEAGHDGSQLRIFEVEAEQMADAAPVESAAAEWSSIWLDALAASVPDEEVAQAAAVLAAPLETASVERRVMAATVDACLVLAGYVVFATVFAYRADVLPGLGMAAIISSVAIASLFVMYQALFFTFSEATPGMLYARIGLCTFDDENPTRAAMRKRILAVLLAGSPLGLGFLWAWIDDDRLGWHDRIARMYQRGY